MSERAENNEVRTCPRYFSIPPMRQAFSCERQAGHLGACGPLGKDVVPRAPEASSERGASLCADKDEGWPDTPPCQRPRGHVGPHQSDENGAFYSWPGPRTDSASLREQAIAWLHRFGDEILTEHAYAELDSILDAPPRPETAFSALTDEQEGALIDEMNAMGKQEGRALRLHALEKVAEVAREALQQYDEPDTTWTPGRGIAAAAKLRAALAALSEGDGT